MKTDNIQNGEYSQKKSIFAVLRVNGLPESVTSVPLDVSGDSHPGVGKPKHGICFFKGTQDMSTLYMLTESEVYGIPDRAFTGAGCVVKRLISLWPSVGNCEGPVLYAFTLRSNGLLHPVGGKVEYGETPLSALRREILEEIGYFKNYSVVTEHTFVRDLVKYPDTADFWHETYRMVDWWPMCEE